MKRSLTPRSLAVVAISVTISFATMLQPAHAQYFGNYFGSYANMPYYLGSSLLYPLSRVFLGGGTSMYNYANPYFMSNRLLNGTINTTGLYRAPGYGQNPVGYGQSGQNGIDPNSSVNGSIQPDQDAVLMPLGAGQTNAFGTPAMLPRQKFGPYGQPLPNQFGQMTQGQYGQMSSNQYGQMPPTAPQYKKAWKLQQKQQKQMQKQMAKNPNSAASAAPQVVSQIPSSPSNAPLAQGFVTMVNSKFDGDISKALFNADGRSWAHTVGLVDNNEIFGADLSQERVLVINKIFKDPGLDACSKLDAAKILLRSSAPSTAVAGSAK
jgi:hypothetical protein